MLRSHVLGVLCAWPHAGNMYAPGTCLHVYCASGDIVRRYSIEPDVKQTYKRKNGDKLDELQQALRVTIMSTYSSSMNIYVRTW